MQEEYSLDCFKVGMIIIYKSGMREDIVGSINIITDIVGNAIRTRRWNSDRREHEAGQFNTPIEKYKIKILGNI